MNWSFYDAETGVFADRTVCISEALIEANTPAGLVAMQGKFDPRSQRVDVATGEVVAYDPPEDRSRAPRARDRIRTLELRSIRPLRELALDPDNADARQALQAIDAAITTLRADLTAPP